MADLTHIAGRVAVAAGAPENPEAARSQIMAEYYANEYVRRLARDPGDGARFLHQLRHETEDVDPWRLVELVAAKALPRKDGNP